MTYKRALSTTKTPNVKFFLEKKSLEKHLTVVAVGVVRGYAVGMKDKELAAWIEARLAKCLPMDFWQHDALAALAKKLK